MLKIYLREYKNDFFFFLFKDKLILKASENVEGFMSVKCEVVQ